MASVGAIWGPATLRLLRVAVANSASAVRAQLARPGRQPIHPTALLRQQKRGTGWFSSRTLHTVRQTVNRWTVQGPSSGSRLGKPFDRSRLYSSSNTSRKVAQSSGRAPFSSTLRPNLTGGAFPRTAGGYSTGGSARYFSHTPAAQAQVVQNVSQAVRAFFISGQKLQYDGLDVRGQRKYRAVSKTEGETIGKLRAVPAHTPGSFIDFRLNPTVTAVGPLAAAITRASGELGFRAETAEGVTLNTEGFLDELSADFGRALKDLTAVYADLRRLAVLGDLPITKEPNHALRVRFPGVDAQTLNRLCEDIGIQRGIIGQDADFDTSAGVPMALRFPFASTSDKTVTSPGGSLRSLESRGFDELSELSEDESFLREAFREELAENPWASESEWFESVSPPISSAERVSEDFEGLEGIYRFIEECDRARGRVG